MNHTDFLVYLGILEEKPFSIYPPPTGPDKTKAWHLAKFTYVDHSRTHVKIKEEATDKIYDVPLVLVEFASLGVLRVSRQMIAYNGSFV